MKQIIVSVAVSVVFTVAVFGFQALRGAAPQNRPPQQTPAEAVNGQQPVRQAAPNADPYANNPVPGSQQFPLAAPARKDSNAMTTAPANAVNQGPFDPANWKFAPAFNPPSGSKVLNPVKLKMMQGRKVTGGTLFSSTDRAIYCSMA